jgi:hypothetical protein
MAIVFWSKVYISFQKKRDLEERKWELIINSIFALLFTFALIDLVLTLPKIIEILQMISKLGGG